MLKDTTKNFKKYYFLCVSFVVALCYGFTLTNFAMGIDDEAFKGYFGSNALLSQGRWGFLIMKKTFNSYEFLPFWRDFIAICLVIFGLTIFNLIFKKYSNNFWDNTLSVIFTCIAISFPYIASLFVFMMTTVETGLVYTLVAFSLYFYFYWVLEGKHWINLIYSICALTFAISFSETAPVVFLLIFFITYFLRALKTDEKIKLTTFLLSIIKVILLILVSIIFWKIGGIFFQKILHIGNANYVNNYINYDFSGIMPFLRSVKRFVFSQCHVIINGLKLDYATKIVSIMTFVAPICVVVLSIKRKQINIFLYGMGIIISAFALPIFTGNPALPHRTLTSFSFLISFSFCLLYIVFKDIHIKKFKLKYVVLFLIVLNVFYQSKQMNETFFADYKSYQYDVTMTSQIYHDIKSITDNNKVIFIGIPSDFNQVVEPSVGNSLFVWDRECNLPLELQSSRLYEFFRQHGYDIYPPQFYDANKLKIQSKNMLNWPKYESIKDFDDYVIVKLGKSFLDN